MRAWAAALTDQGVAALLETLTATGLARRVLARDDGERDLTDLRHIGQEFRQLAGERLGLDPPQLFAGAFDPHAVGRRRTEPIEPGGAGLLVLQEGVEIAADLIEDFFTRFGNSRAAFDEPGCFLGKIVRRPAG